MCIVTYALDAHPTYKLILAANRDEFLHRPTEGAAWRSAALAGPGEDILCGLDTVAGGTWLGLTKNGQVGVLTNFTEPPPPYKPSSSRGSILASYLAPPPTPEPTHHTPLEFLSALAPSAPTYAGFNVLLFSLFPDPSSHAQDGKAQVGYLSNRLPAVEPVAVEGRVRALSNSLLEDPWEKTERVKGALAGLLAEECEEGKAWEEKQWLERLEGIMSPSVPTVDRSTFRQSIRIPPLLLPLPPSDTPRWYATRLLTTVLVTHAGEYVFVERDVCVLGSTSGEPERGGGARVFRGRLERDG